MSVLFKPRWLALHVFSVIVVVGCAGAAYWQFVRADAGHGRSFGYALQWPAIGLFGLGVWAWLCRDGVRSAGAPPSERDHEPERVPVRTTVVPVVSAAEDPELAAYNAMLARLADKDTR